jgi:alpha/beta superfamily hydrolase
LHGGIGNGTDVLDIGAKLSKVGINALTFNYSGTHKSEGKYNWDNTQKDIQAAFEFIHQSKNIRQYKIDITRIYLGGYSHGGGMAFTYAAKHPEIKAIFSIGGNDLGVFMEEYNRNPEWKKMIDKVFNDLKNQYEKVRFAPGGTPEEIAEMNIIESNPTYHLPCVSAATIIWFIEPGILEKIMTTGEMVNGKLTEGTIVFCAFWWLTTLSMAFITQNLNYTLNH